MATNKRFVKVGLQLVIFGALVLMVLNYQPILDQWALQTYKPAAAVASIESRLQLTDTGRALLYRSDPRIDNKAAFNIDCATTKGSLELGCFYRNLIYVLQIDNASLAPEMDVVTAHELLHAAWTRLGDSERSTLTNELKRVYGGLNDSDLTSRMAEYAKSEPGQESNELHSILGTEYTQLSPTLEKYYARYFKQRSVVVAAHQSYQNVFTSRRSELEQQLATIRTLKGQLSTINGQMTSYRNSGRIASYNALVPRQNQLVDDINNRIGAYQAGVDEFNALSRSLDSQLITDTETNVTQ